MIPKHPMWFTEGKTYQCWCYQSQTKEKVTFLRWCWSWNASTLAIWWEELTHWKRPWCWERPKAGGEGDGRGWDGWMASRTQWTWVWASSGSWWWTGKPGVLQCMGSQRVEHDWVTELIKCVPHARISINFSCTVCFYSQKTWEGDVSLLYRWESEVSEGYFLQITCVVVRAQTLTQLSASWPPHC